MKMPCEDEGHMGHCECYYAEGQCCWCEEFFGPFTCRTTTSAPTQ